MVRLLKYVVILAAVAVTGQAAAQSSDRIDWNRMQRDLEIMETVLNSLIQPPQYGLSGLSSNGARGLYFDGYGVVFQIEFGGHSFFAFRQFEIEESLEEAEVRVREMREKAESAPPGASEENRSGVVVVDGNTAALIDGQGESVEQKIQKLQEMLVQFLGDYADAIGQLQPDDRVTVLVNFGSSSRTFVFDAHTFSESESLPATLEASAQKSDIVAYRKGKVDRDTFRERLTLTTRSPDAGKNKHIEILANILSTALHRKQGPAVAFESSHRGLYLEGLGAVFFLKGDLLNELAAPSIDHYFEKYMTRPPKPPAPEPRRERVQQSLADFKQELVKLVGDYGHTLRTLAADEYVVIDVDFRNTLHLLSDSPQQLILKVQKEHLDQYDRGDLTLTQLRLKTEFIEH